MTVEHNYRKKKSRAEREDISAGQPESLSWDETPWEYDDHAEDHVSEGVEMTLQEVGTVMGISRERVRQLETNVEKKLAHLRAVGFNTNEDETETKWAFREIIKRFDKERLNRRLAFAQRILDDDELSERVQSIYGDSLNDEEIDFSKFVTIAKALDNSKGVELRLVGTDDRD